MLTLPSQPPILPAFRLSYRAVVFLASAGLLLYATWLPSSAIHPWIVLVMTLFVALQVHFPLRLLRREDYLLQMVTLGGGLLYGAATAGWAVCLGILVGNLSLRYWPGRRAKTRGSQPPWRLIGDSSLNPIGRHNLTLILILVATGTSAGLVGGPDAFASDQPWTKLIPPLLSFAILYATLFLADALLDQPEPFPRLKHDILTLFLIDFLPLPFVLLTVLAYPTLGLSSLVALGSAQVLIAILLNGITLARVDLERRVQELSTLNQISQVLRSSLDLNNLLSEIQRQVSEILGVNNFYVALYDREEQHIWYPLAVKFGVRQDWPARSLQDRLTDRVILEGKPLTLSRYAAEGLSLIDLPPSEVTPTAWIGVPLVSSGQAFGCLALFSLAPRAGFTSSDLDLLTILSGQVSVAIDNALLYKQAQRRLILLETLNRLSRLITASLDPKEVLSLVCSSFSQVSGDRPCAVYLVDGQEDRIWLAHAHRLSDGFVRSNQSFAITHSWRTRCLISGQPVFSAETNNSLQEAELLASLAQEGIQSFGDFPMATAEGQIGILSVYFKQPHTFSAEEVEYLQTFASQAAQAISNARLHASTDMALAQRAHQLSILEAVGRELSAAIRSERLFEMILTHALDFTGSPWGCLGLFDPDTGTIQIKASHGYTAARNSYPVGQGIGGRAVRTRQVQNVGDVRLDPEYIDQTGGSARSQLSVPLLHEGRVLGVLTLEKPQAGGYSLEDQAFIGQLANQSVIALQNASLFADVQHSHDRLNAVLNSAREGIIMIEAGGQIVLANESIQAMTGLLPAELVGRRFNELPVQALKCLGYTQAEADSLSITPDESLAGIRDHAQVAITEKVGLRIRAASPEHLLERSALPVWGHQKQTIGWMILYRDITEEDRIDQARELITETLVHDLRSPLSAVLGALDVIGEETQPEKQPASLTAQALRVARRGAQRVLAMVESLLDISRMQSGSMELILAPLNVFGLSVAAITDFIPQANEFGVILRNEIPATLPKACADQAKITRVLINLLDNALKFTPSGGQVLLSAEELPQGFLAVRVGDSGPGIPEEFREKVFERFTQVPGQRGRRRGSGLGLTFCRLAVEAHGGKIWVEPGPAGGSQFIFTLPIVEPETD